MRTARSLWLILLFAACIPAQTPPILNTTPAAGAVITRDSYQNDLFSVTYPIGWRVITSPASAPLRVIFAAPGNYALIVVSSVPVPLGSLSQGVSCGDPTGWDYQTVALGAQQITILGCTSDRSDSFLQTLDSVVASVRAVS